MIQVARKADGSYDIPVGVEHVGASILDIVSGAMYSNALDVLREYIQNAVDGGASQVRIVVRQHDILVRDNGKGLTLAQLDDARKVAVSRKRTAEVGFRGIGIYSSFSVCNALEVITRPEGSDTVYILRVEYEPMRAAIAMARDGTSEPVSLITALDEHTRLADYTEAPPLDKGGSFTLVRLVGPERRFRDRLNEVTEVESYLRRAVPLEFHPDFEYASVVRSRLAKRGVPARQIAVSLKPLGKPVIDLHQANVPHLLRPIIKTVEDKDGRLVAVMWLCVNRERKSIRSEDVAGFQMRFKSFGIGDRRLLQPLWPGVGSGVLYKHLTGEIYVLDNSLRPSAERGNFEDSHARDVLHDLLKTVFTDLNRDIDARREALADIDKGAKKGEWERVEQGFRNLEIVRQRFPVQPPLTTAEILDPPGERVAAARDAAAAGRGKSKGTKSGSATGRGGGQGAGTGNASGAGGAGGGAADGAGAADGGSDDETVPTIAELLLSLEVDWPSEAGEIFEIIDNALTDVVERRNVEACRRMLQGMLERRFSYRDDAE